MYQQEESGTAECLQREENICDCKSISDKSTEGFLNVFAKTDVFLIIYVY